MCIRAHRFSTRVCAAHGHVVIRSSSFLSRFRNGAAFVTGGARFGDRPAVSGAIDVGGVAAFPGELASLLRRELREAARRAWSIRHRGLSSGLTNPLIDAVPW